MCTKKLNCYPKLLYSKKKNVGVGMRLLSLASMVNFEMSYIHENGCVQVRTEKGLTLSPKSSPQVLEDKMLRDTKEQLCQEM